MRWCLVRSIWCTIRLQLHLLQLRYVWLGWLILLRSYRLPCASSSSLRTHCKQWHWLASSAAALEPAPSQCNLSTRFGWCNLSTRFHAPEAWHGCYTRYPRRAALEVSNQPLFVSSHNTSMLTSTQFHLSSTNPPKGWALAELSAAAPSFTSSFDPVACCGCSRPLSPWLCSLLPRHLHTSPLH